jgi:uncharacterized protein YuzE
MSFSFRVSVETDLRSGRIMAVYLRIRKGKAAKSVEYCDGAAFANYDRRGDLIGIELLAPCRLSVLNKIAVQPQVWQFIGNAIPRKMALAGR